MLYHPLITDFFLLDKNSEDLSNLSFDAVVYFLNAKYLFIGKLLEKDFTNLRFSFIYVIIFFIFIVSLTNLYLFTVLMCILMFIMVFSFLLMILIFTYTYCLIGNGLFKEFLRNRLQALTIHFNQLLAYRLF